MKYTILILSFFISFYTFSFAQKQSEKYIQKGNKAYKQEKYIDAEIEYRKALEDKDHSINASYNLGNALYKQGKDQKALEQYQVVTNNEANKQKLSMAWHNIGNVFMKFKDYKKSIEAYKNALRNNSKDNETRYNLALAQKLFQKQQNRNKQKEQNQKKQNNQQKNQKEKQESSQSSNEISKENAIQILDALIQNEKNIREKVRSKQIKRQERKLIEKNW